MHEFLRNRFNNQNYPWFPKGKFAKSRKMNYRQLTHSCEQIKNIILQQTPRKIEQGTQVPQMLTFSD